MRSASFSSSSSIRTPAIGPPVQPSSELQTSHSAPNSHSEHYSITPPLHHSAFPLAILSRNLACIYVSRIMNKRNEIRLNPFERRSQRSFERGRQRSSLGRTKNSFPWPIAPSLAEISFLDGQNE